MLNPGSVAEGVLLFDLPLAANPAEVALHGEPPFAFLGPGARVRLN